MLIKQVLPHCAVCIGHRRWAGTPNRYAPYLAHNRAPYDKDVILVLGVKFKAHPLETIQLSMQHMYGLDLQVEGQGQEWVSLEGFLKIRGAEGSQQIGLRLNDKNLKFTKEHQTLYRYPDAHCAKAYRVLKGLIPAQAKNAVTYRLCHEDLRRNIQLIERDMLMKGYSASSWKPMLRHNLMKWGTPRDLLP